MRKIIDGKLYDTNTAKLIYEYEHTDAESGSYWENLYRKRTGEYFLYGAGGPNSPYAESSPSDPYARTGGSDFKLLTYDQALKWGERNLDVDDYEKIFGLPSEDEEVILSVRIPVSAKRLLDAEQSRSGRAVGDIVTTLINDNLGD